MKKKNDVKFIIYQSLYIFIICVIAIKGASIDLTEVEERRMKGETLAEIDTVDNVVIDKKEFAGYIKLSPGQLVVTKEEYDKNTQEFTPVNISTGQLYTTNNPDPVTRPEEIIKENPERPDKDIKINISDYANKLNLTQFTAVSVNNPFDQAMEFAGRNIPPKSAGSITLGGDNVMVMKVGSSTATINIKPNQKPVISFNRIATMNDETKVTTLQRTTCYRVTITDDFPDQLDVKFSNGVTVKEVGKKIYDVTLNAFSSIASFDNFTDGKSSPYSLGFTVTVTDKLAKHVQTGQQQFIFGEW
jgi:hypothetical protein